jgi:hypothetical protein
VDYIARKAQREAQAIKAKRLNPPVTVPVGDNAAREKGAPLPLVAQLERIIHKDVAIRALPICTAVPDSRQNVFHQELFWIHGYSTEVSFWSLLLILRNADHSPTVVVDDGLYNAERSCWWWAAEYGAVRLCDNCDAGW